MKTNEITASIPVCTMSNALIRAGHGLTLAEKRLVMIAISKLDSTQPAQVNNALETKITAAEYANKFNVSMDTAYDQLDSASTNLHKRIVVFYEPSYRRKSKKVELARSEMNWVGQVDYRPGDVFVVLHWWGNMMNHLMGLKRQFTSYKLQQASALRSVSSWRLLELMTRFEDNGWAQYDIDDFATSMDATDKQKSDFAAIRRKIIEPAVQELVKDGWEITWATIKSGRKVKAVRFDFKKPAKVTGKKAE